MVRLILALIISGLLLVSCNNEENPSAPVNMSTSSGDKTMDSISAEIAKARDYQAKQQYRQALQIADAMIERYPGQLDALSIKADILKEQGKTSEALLVLEKAYAMQPKDKETAYNLAYEYADAKSTKALSLADTLIKYDKTETVARAWYVKAYYYNQIGNHKEALRFLDSSIAADYNFTDAYFDKGQIQFGQKQYEAALKTFAIGQKLGPAEAQFYFWIGKTQEAMGQKQDAKANYERAYALDKSLTEAKKAAE